MKKLTIPAQAYLEGYNEAIDTSIIFVKETLAKLKEVKSDLNARIKESK